MSAEPTITVTLSRDEIHALRKALYTETTSLRRNVNMFALNGECESLGAQNNRSALNLCEDLSYNLSQALSNPVEVAR
jgi:hypothetical protein